MDGPPTQVYKTAMFRASLRHRFVAWLAAYAVALQVFLPAALAISSPGDAAAVCLGYRSFVDGNGAPAGGSPGHSEDSHCCAVGCCAPGVPPGLIAEIVLSASPIELSARPSPFVIVASDHRLALSRAPPVA